MNPLFMGSEFILKAKEYIDKNTPEDVPSVINFGHFEALERRMLYLRALLSKVLLGQWMKIGERKLKQNY